MSISGVVYVLLVLAWGFISELVDFALCCPVVGACNRWLGWVWATCIELSLGVLLRFLTFVLDGMFLFVGT